MPYCPNCGAKLDQAATTCTTCQASPPPIPNHAPPMHEETLYRFGSFGVGITFGRPGLFKWTKNNIIEVVLTNFRLCGVWNPSIARTFFSSKRGEVFFQIPLSEIVAFEPINFLANRCLWIQYREGAEMKEVTIECALGFHDRIDHLRQLLTQIKTRP